MKTLSIDIETFSDVDLRKAGVYRYAESDAFKLLLFAYSVDMGPVTCISVAEGEEIPAPILAAIHDGKVLKTAYNAQFERVCLSKHLGTPLTPDQWECTSVKASMLGLPIGLANVASVLGLANQKDLAGTALINYFCKPCKPTASNGGRTRNLPEHSPMRWDAFKNYCAKDVSVENEIRERIDWFDIPQTEKKLYDLDQRINDKGVLVDKRLISEAIRIDEVYKGRLMEEAIRITGLANPNSTAQLIRWFSAETGDDVTTLKKADVPVMLAKYDSKVVTRMLEIRQELAKTSIKKYAAMTHAVCNNNRICGLLHFYGANRTGRWAGRLVQVQNLPQNLLADIDVARTLVREGDADTVELAFGNIPDTLSQLIRTAFVAPRGKTFVVADFSAIEARVIAWLANEKWRLDVFNTHGKIYEASASQMFKIPIEEVTKGSHWRKKGKVAELACGYQGGPNALINMGALKGGLTEDDLAPMIDAWRAANPAICKLWADVNAAAIRAVDGERIDITRTGVSFFRKKEALFIGLPSGRKLAYHKPMLKSGKFGGKALVYQGMDQVSKKWGAMDTYGGKIVENLTQAIARDCLADSMLRLDAAGYTIVMHVHDEVVIEVNEETAEADLGTICDIMGAELSWAKGLPLRADAYITKHYKKD